MLCDIAFRYFYFYFVTVIQLFMKFSLYCFADAPHSEKNRRLGKVHATTLPLEYELARFIEEVENSPPSWRADNPADQWRGVTTPGENCVSERPDEGVSLMWGSLKLRGSLCWKFLPCGVNQIYINRNKLTGEIDLGMLPSKMMYLSAADNLFCGSLNLTQLPSTLKYLYLNENKFEGEVCFSTLPTSLAVLDLSENEGLVGKVSHPELPPALKRLGVGGTQIQYLKA